MEIDPNVKVDLPMHKLSRDMLERLVLETRRIEQQKKETGKPA